MKLVEPQCLQEQGVWHTSKYMDTADVPSGPEAEPQMWDRRLLYCVPVCSLILYLPHNLETTKFDQSSVRIFILLMKK